MSLVSGARPVLDKQNGEVHSGGFEELLNSDRLKYRRTLAVQRLQRDPDALFMELRYHVAWNIVSRKPVFTHSVGAVDAIDTVLLNCGEVAGGFVSLLWLAPDHMHIYLESDGEKSVDAVVRHVGTAGHSVGKNPRRRSYC
jgi:hypothetical protein